MVSNDARIAHRAPFITAKQGKTQSLQKGCNTMQYHFTQNEDAGSEIIRSGLKSSGLSKDIENVILSS